MCTAHRYRVLLAHKGPFYAMCETDEGLLTVGMEDGKAKLWEGAKASAELKYSAVPAYGIKALPNSKWTGEQLKHLLSEHSMSMTGNKATLIKKVAKVATTEYQAQKEKLDRYFDKTQYITIPVSLSKSYEGFPGLAQDDPISGEAIPVHR